MFHSSDDDDGQLVVPPGFHVYQRTPTDDALLVQFYAQATTDGSAKYLFYDTTLSGVFRYLSPERAVTLMRVRDGVPWLVAWFEPCFDGAYLGLWAAEPLRYTIEGIYVVCALIDAGLDHRCTILGTTRQELIDEHKALGYAELGAVPALWDGRDVHWVYVTREGFEASRIVQRWRRNRAK